MILSYNGQYIESNKLYKYINAFDALEGVIPSKINVYNDNFSTINQDILDKFNIKIISVKISYLRKIGYNSFEEWLKDPNNFYVGRKGRIFIGKGNEKYIFNYKGSIFGNPFKVKDNNIDECLQNYYNYVKNDKVLYNKL